MKISDPCGEIQIKFWSIQKSRAELVRKKGVVIPIGREMIYECETCGEKRNMILERGLEDFSINGWKPVPFTILCPKCFGSMRHVDWDRDRLFRPYGDYFPGRDIGHNLFANFVDSDCGLPVFSEALDGLIPEDKEIHALSESNRAQRRARKKHPMWEETRYKRADY